jgi:hypothetical protein
MTLAHSTCVAQDVRGMVGWPAALVRSWEFLPDSNKIGFYYKLRITVPCPCSPFSHQLQSCKHRIVAAAYMQKRICQPLQNLRVCGGPQARENLVRKVYPRRPNPSRASMTAQVNTEPRKQRGCATCLYHRHACCV